MVLPWDGARWLGPASWGVLDTAATKREFGARIYQTAAARDQFHATNSQYGSGGWLLGAATGFKLGTTDGRFDTATAAAGFQILSANTEREHAAVGWQALRTSTRGPHHAKQRPERGYGDAKLGGSFHVIHLTLLAMSRVTRRWPRSNIRNTGFLFLFFTSLLSFSSSFSFVVTAMNAYTALHRTIERLFLILGHSRFPFRHFGGGLIKRSTENGMGGWDEQMTGHRRSTWRFLLCGIEMLGSVWQRGE